MHAKFFLFRQLTLQNSAFSSFSTDVHSPRRKPPPPPLTFLSWARSRRARSFPISQLCIEIDPIFMVPEFTELIQCLSDLESLIPSLPTLDKLWLCGQMMLAWWIVRGLLKGAPLCHQNFRSFVFRTKWPWKYLRILSADWHCRKGRMKLRREQIIETNAKLAKVFRPPTWYGMIKKG